MKIVSTNVYVGPNVYAHFPVIRHVLDLGELENWPSGKLGEGFRRTIAGGSCPGCMSTVVRTRRRAASSGVCVRTKAPGWGMSWSMSQLSCRMLPVQR